MKMNYDYVEKILVYVGQNCHCERSQGGICIPGVPPESLIEYLLMLMKADFIIGHIGEHHNQLTVSCLSWKGWKYLEDLTEAKAP